MIDLTFEDPLCPTCGKGVLIAFEWPIEDRLEVNNIVNTQFFYKCGNCGEEFEMPLEQE